MEQLKILTDDAPELRKISTPVVMPDKAMDALAKNMFYTMKLAGGIGLAAPQVGVNKRIITIDTTSSGGKTMVIMFNPEIISATGECEFNEGCLSFPGRAVKTKRNQQVTVQFHDFQGNTVTRTFNGIDSICIQHEIDHLDGKTFFDRESK